MADLYLFAVLIGSRITFEVSETPVKDVQAANALVRALLWPGILGAGLLAIGMLYFWFTFDPSHWMTKAFWFPVLFLSLTLGPVLYYFFSYRKRVGHDAQGRVPGVPDR
jgi:hypothetical protein